MSGQPSEKRFEDFFVEGSYVVLKNYMYNYRCRVRKINQALNGDQIDRILEVGSGMSPIVTHDDRAVYSELSFTAIRTSKQVNGRGHYVVADGTRLPFRDGAFSHAVCSEVLEHVENDQEAVRELSRVLKPSGKALITVPHRKFYYAADDRFVHHFRRYEIAEMAEKIHNAGMALNSTRKVLGPLEKVTMYSFVMIFAIIQRLFLHGKKIGSKPHPLAHALAPLFDWCNRFYALLARLDAAIMPKSLATVILFEARKES